MFRHRYTLRVSFKRDERCSDTMRIMDALTGWTAVAALGTFVAAGVAAVAARQSFNSAKEANTAAGLLVGIERDRRHDELAPVFDLQFTTSGGDTAVLQVTLAGGRLESLDEVTLTILDDQDHWAGGLPDGVTQEGAEAFVWGPYQFDTSVTIGPFVSNRQSQPRPYSRLSGKDWELLPLRRTGPPRWQPSYTGAMWREHYAGKPIRLLITCRGKGDEPWMLQKDVSTKQEAGPELRKQAGEIRVERRTYDGAQAGVLPDNGTMPVYMLVVTNGSSRPIRYVAAAIEVDGLVSGDLANVVGTLGSVHTASGTPDDLFTPATTVGFDLEVLQAGDKAAFVWSYIAVATHPNAKFTVRFTDDDEIAWEVGPDLRLTPLENRHRW